MKRTLPRLALVLAVVLVAGATAWWFTRDDSSDQEPLAELTDVWTRSTPVFPPSQTWSDGQAALSVVSSQRGGGPAQLTAGTIASDQPLPNRELADSTDLEPLHIAGVPGTDGISWIALATTPDSAPGRPVVSAWTNSLAVPARPFPRSTVPFDLEPVENGDDFIHTGLAASGTGDDQVALAFALQHDDVQLLASPWRSGRWEPTRPPPRGRLDQISSSGDGFVAITASGDEEPTFTVWARGISDDRWTQVDGLPDDGTPAALLDRNGGSVLVWRSGDEYSIHTVTSDGRTDERVPPIEMSTKTPAIEAYAESDGTWLIAGSMTSKNEIRLPGGSGRAPGLWRYTEGDEAWTRLSSSVLANQPDQTLDALVVSGRGDVTAHSTSVVLGIEMLWRLAPFTED